MLFPNTDGAEGDLDHLDQCWSNIQEWADASLDLTTTDDQTIYTAIDEQMKIVGAKDCCFGTGSASLTS